MTTAHYILALAWILYCVLHSVLAAGSVKAVMGKWLGKNARYYRFGYTLLAFVGFVGILLYQVSIESPLLFDPPAVVLWAGIALAAIGSALVMLNILKYFMQLSGVRWLTHENPSARLERGGFHRYVRHPLYFSTFLFIWSLWLVYPYLSLLIANVIITVYTLIGIGFEEKKLLIEFGEEYEDYRKSVPKIIPSFKNRAEQ
ncbi:MAG TPA: isoprenylcysteine carboxylmethyltransferase family protein [Chitinophagaceae bacterium]|nr:isoprenylcysteine carboxylmethyltransferase family protein [Chitinophagaceae bacterium]